MPDLTNLGIENAGKYADVLRSDPIAMEQYHEMLSDPSLTMITTEQGKTIIKEQQYPIKSGVAIAKTKPWSSWWFPAKEDYLFADSRIRYSSPLSKYDAYTQKYLDEDDIERSSNTAVSFERKIFNPNALPWEGLCDAWAIAAIASPEPLKSVKVKSRMKDENITFSVGDLKALILKTYEGTDDLGLKYYGQKFTGNFDGWIYPDLFPEQFHRFIEVQLFKNKEPFIMDHDPGPEVWNVPVFKANYIIDKIPGKPDSLFVRTWLYSAESVQRDKIDFVGTKEAVREYNYVLEGDRNSNGDLVIHRGYWVVGPDGVDSRRDHPDYVIRIPDIKKLIRKSWNPAIKVKAVDELVRLSGQ